jgi:hypothetical protein
LDIAAWCLCGNDKVQRSGGNQADQGVRKAQQFAQEMALANVQMARPGRDHPFAGGGATTAFDGQNLSDDWRRRGITT